MGAKRRPSRRQLRRDLRAEPRPQVAPRHPPWPQPAVEHGRRALRPPAAVTAMVFIGPECPATKEEHMHNYHPGRLCTAAVPGRQCRLAGAVGLGLAFAMSAAVSGGMAAEAGLSA